MTTLTAAQRIQELRKQRKIAQREAMETDETMLMVAAVDLDNQQFSDVINSITDKLEELKKTTGVQQDWTTYPAYEYGLQGVIKRFLTVWVYLPDALKRVSGISIPTTAFEVSDLDAWGSLPYSSKLGELKNFEKVGDDYVPTMVPNMSAVQNQINRVLFYLNEYLLGQTLHINGEDVSDIFLSTEDMKPIPTQQEWEANAVARAIKAELKAAEISLARKKAQQKIDAPKGEVFKVNLSQD